MAFYPQFPAFYAYPVPFAANQEFYAMYPHHNAMETSGGGGGTGSGSVYYENNNNNAGQTHHVKFKSDKVGYNNRKESTDSGISDFSVLSSRKTSSTSTISNASIMEEASSLEDIKEEAPFVEPDEDTCVQIVQQVEFYFSDANITKDKFLLKHVKRNKEGFVSLKLISSFKRVKHLTKDWRQVAFAIEKKSDKLEVNDVKTKVRRLDPLPEYDETTPSRTVVAMNLPLERPTIESVAEIFSACGDIVLVRILRPGNPIPADVRPFVNKHPEMTSIVCALVEFDRTEFALKAVRELNNEEEDKMKVIELIAPPPAKTGKKSDDKKNSNKTTLQKIPGLQAPNMIGSMMTSSSAPAQPQRRFSHAGMVMVPGVPGNQQGPDGVPRRKISLFHNMKFSPIAEERNLKVGLNPNAPIFTMQQAQQIHPMMHQRRMSKPGYYQPQAYQNLATMPLMPIMDPMMHHAMPAAPAWMTRRISGSVEMSTSGLALPPNVVRLPRGPDKGKGFQKWCRSRMSIQPENEMPVRKPGSRAVPIVAPPEMEEEKKQEKVTLTQEEEEVKESEAAEGCEAAAAVTLDQSAGKKEYDNQDDEGHFSDQEPVVSSVSSESAAVADPAATDLQLLCLDGESEKSR